MKVLVKYMMLLGCLLLFISSNSFQPKTHWVYKSDFHHSPSELIFYMNKVISEGRIEVFTLREQFKIKDLPDYLSKNLKPINLDRQLPEKTNLGSIKKSISDPDPRIIPYTEQFSAESYEQTLQWIVDMGKRTSVQSIADMVKKFDEYGYQPKHDYNIQAWKMGEIEPQKVVIIQAHMDTVNGTVGADDNASGAAAVFEAARILKDVKTKYSILFLINEDEEIGLLGSNKFVKDFKKQGRLDDIVFVVNMDMIGYNENGRMDIETEPEFESTAKWVAEQTLKYTTLEPNIVLNAWGSDHVPFIKAGVPSVLTIEHWKTHTPCWHKPCDKIETINFEYAGQIARLNIANVLAKAELLK